MFTDRGMRGCIVEVLRSHSSLLTIAVRTRAKFEGWLKLELARALDRKTRVRRVVVEEPYGTRKRADIAFTAGGVRYYVELKTANTNWRVPGVENRSRPITKNIAGIIKDMTRLQDHGLKAFMGFVLFPVPASDCRWHRYLQRISAATGVPLTERDHCSRLMVRLGSKRRCEVVVCCGAVERGTPR